MLIVACHRSWVPSVSVSEGTQNLSRTPSLAEDLL